MHGRFRRGEFADALTAAAAGRAQAFAIADDKHFGDAAPAAGDHRADRPRFSAGALRIGGVLDVAAGENRPRFVPQRRADAKMRIGRIGPRPRRARCVEQGFNAL